ncbi:hypothetical protein Bca52824_090347 [Brassica carinata]|uniref:Uncharacterized protein n=1 Tax=Brassica carinata TaxID=52824 RepID=A0A8X7NX01_BRACI|nr:hypothetical protein Bca52824_090347 [Brassica carinata]
MYSYDLIYLGGLNGTTQICAKSVLAQMMLVIFTRSEEDSLADVTVKTVYVNELLTFTDKSVNEGSSVYFCQGFVNEVMAAGQGSPLLLPMWFRFFSRTRRRRPL